MGENMKSGIRVESMDNVDLLRANLLLELLDDFAATNMASHGFEIWLSTFVQASYQIHVSEINQFLDDVIGICIGTQR